MNIRFGPIFLAAIFLTSCATRYQPMGFGGGYSDVLLDGNTAQVQFSGNGYTSLATVKKFLLLRCAEVTLKNYFTYFQIVEADGDTSRGTVSMPSTYNSNTTASVSQYGNTAFGQANTYATMTQGPTFQISKHSVSAIVKMYKEKPAENGRIGYNAKQMVANLRGYSKPRSYQNTASVKKTTVIPVETVKKSKVNEKAIVWSDKSYRSLQKKNWVEVIRTASVAISISPDYESPYINRSWAYIEKGFFDKALEDVRKVLTINPKNASAYNNRGYAQQQLGKIDLAVSDYKTACELKENAGCLNFKSIKGYRPDDVHELLEMSNKKFSENSWQEVEGLSNNILRFQPNNEVALVNRAGAYAELGQLENALEDCNKAIGINPDFALAYHNRAYIYELMKNTDVAILGYETSCELGVKQSCKDAIRLKGILAYKRKVDSK